MIKQRLATDCGIATLANALQITYEQSLELYGPCRARHGVSIQHTAGILFSLGYSPVYVPFSGFTQLTGIPATTANPAVLQGSPAILQVLTDCGLVHQVYFDGQDIHDPSNTVQGPQKLSDYCLVDGLFVINQEQAIVRKSGAAVTSLKGDIKAGEVPQ